MTSNLFLGLYGSGMPAHKQMKYVNIIFTSSWQDNKIWIYKGHVLALYNVWMCKTKLQQDRCCWISWKIWTELLGSWCCGGNLRAQVPSQNRNKFDFTYFQVQISPPHPTPPKKIFVASSTALGKWQFLARTS